MHYQKGQKVWFVSLGLNTLSNTSEKPVVAPWENHFSSIIMKEMKCNALIGEGDVTTFVDQDEKVWMQCNHVTGLETRIIEPANLDANQSLPDLEEFMASMCREENRRMMDLKDFLELLLRIAGNEDIQDSDRRVASEQYGEIVMYAQRVHGIGILRRSATTVEIAESRFDANAV